MIPMSPEVWHGVNHTSQALISTACGSGEYAHAADRAARAACVSSGSCRLKGDWLLVHALHGHL